MKEEKSIEGKIKAKRSKIIPNDLRRLIHIDALR